MVARELVGIGTHLRLVAFGIECAHGVGVAHSEVDRALDDDRPDAAGNFDVRAKRYSFCAVGGVRIEGIVDEYENGSLWLVIDGHRELERDSSRVVALAKLTAEHIDRERTGSDET